MIIIKNKERELTEDERLTVTSVHVDFSKNEVYYYQNDEPIIENKLTIELINEMQYNELQPTDWYFVRKVELGINVPAEIINERLAIRAKYDALKLEL